MVGGKSCGMLLSRKIVEKSLPEVVRLSSRRVSSAGPSRPR